MNAETAQWIKSRRSGNSGNCVEVSFLPDGHVAVRDSKQQGTGPHLIFTPAEWDAFIEGVIAGDFDRSQQQRQPAHS